jgi:hypothetical protein
MLTIFKALFPANDKGPGALSLAHPDVASDHRTDHRFSHLQFVARH